MSDNPLLAWRDRYYHDPVLFVREVLGVEPYGWQIELMTNIARCWALPPERRTSRDRQHSARSGHRVGKSTVLGWIALWAFLTRFRVKVIITAPTSQQLYDALFAEMKSWARKLPPDILALITIKSDRIELVMAPEDAFIAASTSRQESPEALQGKHSDWVLLIGDEASGIPEAVFEASAGSMAAPNAIMILASNPVRGTGYFADTHGRLSDRWTCYHISSESLPPERVDRVWIDDMAFKYGRESNAFRIRVEGNFPKADSNTIIPLELVLTAVGRDIRTSPDDPQYWGFDVARDGEDASAFVRRSRRALLCAPQRFRNQDTTQLASALLGAYQGAPKAPAEIMIDVIGWGAGMVDRAREFKLPVMGVNTGEATTVMKEASYLNAGYANQRSEAWFKMREWFEAKDITIPETVRGTPEHATMERLIEELTMVRYHFTNTGKLLVESKDSLRERKVGSPDMADALALTFLGRAALLGGEGRYRSKTSVKRNRKSIV